MATGINKNAGTVNVGDHVSIVGKVVSFTGSGSKATVTVQSPQYDYNGNTTSADSADLHAVLSLSGKHYGVAGDNITVMGRVTAISGSGVNAVLTVQLVTSQNSINTAAGNCNSDNV